MHLHSNRSSIIQKRSSPLASVRNRRSMTLHTLEIVPPKKEAKTFEEIQEDILHSHSRINGIITKFRGLVADKLQAQEMQLLSVFKSTMDKMMEEVEEIVGQYQSVIEEVKLEPAMAKLENELNYFKTEALQLFELNKSHRKQIEELKKSISSYKLDKEIHLKTIEKLTKKIFRNKNSSILTDNTSRLIQPSLPYITQDSTIRYKSIQTQRMKTVGSIHTGRYN